jgi:hypothetical protein
MISQKRMVPDKLAKNAIRYTQFGHFKKSNRYKEYLKIFNLKILILFASALVMFVPFQFNSIRAETGLGTDVFRVILTIIGADKASSGDVVALVTVNDHSRVKFFNVDNPMIDGIFSKRDSSNSSSGSDNQDKLIEYVATFPNLTVNTGDEYKTCVLPLKTLKIMCVEGTNSPAKRPEVVDLSLNSTSTPASPESLTTESTLTSPKNDQSRDSDSDREDKDEKGDR